MALSNKRARKVMSLDSADLLHAAQTVWQGGVACIDLADGLVRKGASSMTLVPIGLYVENEVVASGGSALVQLFKAGNCVWMTNSGSDAVDANDVGKLCYLADDDVVAETSGTQTRPVAGRVKKVDASKGVLVEFRDRSSMTSALTALTDSTGGTANSTLEAIPDPADAPATADALRDDLVANALPAIRNDFADLAAQVNSLHSRLRDAGVMS